MKKRRSTRSTSAHRKTVGTDNPMSDRVAKVFGIAYGEPDPERGLETVRALLGEAHTEEERRALLGYGEVLQMRLMAGRGEAGILD